MKKKILIGLLAIVMCFTLVGCGNNENTTTSDNNLEQKQEQVLSTAWPTNTIFPEPDGCKIIEVKKEDYKNYITVEWDSKESAKTYIEKVKEVEGDNAELIGQGETDETVYYGTYGITITSMNDPQNIVLYK